MTFFKKHKKLVIWGSIILIVLILGIYAYLRISATLHFTLQSELLATHTPAQLVVETTNNATINVSVQTSINTFHACDSICDYDVAGVYALHNRSERNLVHTFSVTTPEKGFGQQLLYLKSSCKTIPSTFCPSSQKTINQTSLIIVNYALRQDEIAVVESLPTISTILTQATKLVEQIRYTKQIYMLWPLQTVKINDDRELSTELTAITNAWRKNEFIYANRLAQDLQQTTSAYNETTAVATTTLLALITQYNQLQTDIVTFLDNQTIREYVTYAQKYDTTAGTVRQAINRLTTILAQTFIEDLPRSQIVATGAMQFLQNKTQVYLTQKDAATNTIAFARTLLPLIETPLTNLSLNMCDATQALLTHNAWALSSNYTQLSKIDAQTIVQPVNATYLFDITTEFCIEQTPSVQINLDAQLSAKNIKLPLIINLSAPHLATPSAQCYLGSQQIACDTKRTPILFIHGHSFDESNSPQISMAAFSHIQEQLEADGYVNAGELLEQTTGTILAPFTMRASYYYIQQYGVGAYSFEIQKSERIENYAIRLKDIINTMKEMSGSQNITIVAHSMGGLVVREYANLFGMDSIDHAITINTPHQGVTGRTVSICDLLGAAKECEDMTVNSTFLRRLPPVTGQWDVIASTGCQMKEGAGDGVVLVQHSVLSGATHHLVNGTCTDALESDLHTSVLEDPRVYKLIVSILN